MKEKDKLIIYQLSCCLIHLIQYNQLLELTHKHQHMHTHMLNTVTINYCFFHHGNCVSVGCIRLIVFLCVCVCVHVHASVLSVYIYLCKLSSVQQKQYTVCVCVFMCVFMCV